MMMTTHQSGKRIIHHCQHILVGIKKNRLVKLILKKHYYFPKKKNQNRQKKRDTAPIYLDQLGASCDGEGLRSQANQLRAATCKKACLPNSGSGPESRSLADCVALLLLVLALASIIIIISLPLLLHITHIHQPPSPAHLPLIHSPKLSRFASFSAALGSHAELLCLAA